MATNLFNHTITHTRVPSSNYVDNGAGTDGTPEDAA